MICSTNRDRSTNLDLCLGVSAGSNSSPYEGLPMQIKSVSRNQNDRFYNVAFGLDRRIYSLVNQTLGVGRGVRLTSNLTRIVVWNQTENGKLQFQSNCLTIMECNKPDTVPHCDPDSPFPVRDPADIRRGAYVKLYPCTGLLAGQRWIVITHTSAPIVTPTPTLRTPSASPSLSPSAYPSVFTPASPTDSPSVGQSWSPSSSPSMVTFSPTSRLQGTVAPSSVVVLRTLVPTLMPSQISNSYSNVEAAPLYAIPVAICLFILAVMIGRYLWNDPKKRCFR